MGNVTALNKNTRLRIGLTKAAETASHLADLVSDPTKRAALKEKALSIQAKARAL